MTTREPLENLQDAREMMVEQREASENNAGNEDDETPLGHELAGDNEE